MATIDLASNSALLSVAEKLTEQNQLLSSVAMRGKSAFVRYSAYADGTDFTETWSSGKNYIGHAVGYEAPVDKSEYTWSLFASNIRETLTVTLPASGWSKNTQAFETPMIGDNSTVFPAPTPECNDAYINAGVMISAANETSLIFTCAEVPTMDLTVEVYITDPVAVVGGGGGLGQSDWAAGEGEPGEILNKPFGDVVIPLGNTLSWDGTPNNNTTVVMSMTQSEGLTEMHVYHVASCVPAPEELFGGTLVQVSPGDNGIAENTIEINANTVHQLDDKVYAIGGEFCWVVAEDNVTLNEVGMPITFAKKGIYFLGATLDGVPMLYAKTLMVPDYNFTTNYVNKLDDKYLPKHSWENLEDKPFFDNTVSFGDTLTWNGVSDSNTISMSISGTTLYFHHVADCIPPADKLVGSIITTTESGQLITTEVASDKIKYSDSEAYVVNGGQGGIVITLKDGVIVDGILFSKKGVYLQASAKDGEMQVVTTSFTITGYDFVDGELKTIDSKFIPTPDWHVSNGAPGYIENKPFYDYIDNFGETVTWDGVETHENDIVMELGDVMKQHMHYLTSNVPTVEELKTGTAVYIEDGEEFTVNLADGVGTNSDGNISFCNGLFQIVPEDILDPIPLKKGIWCQYSRSSNGSVDYGKSLTIPGYNFSVGHFKKIDAKFIDTPDWDAIEGRVGYIKNRPFGTTIGTGDTLHKDFGYSESVDVLGGLLKLYHMCDNVPTAEELVGGIITAHTNGEINTVEITEEMISVAEDGSISVGGDTPFVMIAPSELTEDMDGLQFTLKKGVYFVDLYMGMLATESLQIPGYEFPTICMQKLDAKYLPEGIGYEEIIECNTIEWDGAVDEAIDVIKEDAENDSKVYMHKVSDCTPTAEELTGCTVTYQNADGQDVTQEVENWLLSTEDLYSNEIVTVALKDGVVLGNLTLPTKGIYFALMKTISTDAVSMRAKSLAAAGVTIDTETHIHKIDPKYLPEIDVLSETFATKEELAEKIEVATATVGQTIVVKAVDENGKPTEWEAADMPTFELVSPNGTRYNLAVADDGTLSAVAVVEEPEDPVEPDPEPEPDPEEPVNPDEPVDPEVDPTEPTGDAT